MPNTAIQNFEKEMETMFSNSMKSMPPNTDSFTSAIERINWLKETVNHVNEQIGLLSAKHAGGNEDLKKEMQTLAAARTKKMMDEFKK